MNTNEKKKEQAHLECPPFNIGDYVTFTRSEHIYSGIVIKLYNNSALITLDANSAYDYDMTVARFSSLENKKTTRQCDKQESLGNWKPKVTVLNTLIKIIIKLLMLLFFQVMSWNLMFLLKNDFWIY